MNWKIIVGLLLMAPMAAALIYYSDYQYSHPAMTSTQVSMEIGWLPLICLLPLAAGLILFESGKEDYEDA